MSILDFSSLSDDQLVELIRAALREAVRRGSAVEAAVRSAGLEESEKARIAQAAARKEAERIAREEADRVAREAAERVRREAEKKQEQAAIDKAAKLRALAVRARELFGNGWPEFSVSIWSKAGDKRVYIQCGFDQKFCTYYHTGNARTAPGTIEIAEWAVRERAKALGIEEAAARAEVKEFCESLCRGWESLRLDVNESNAPRDRRCYVDRWLIKRGMYFRGRGRYADFGSDGEAKAIRYLSREAAEGDLAAAEAQFGRTGEPDAFEVVPIKTWVAFAAEKEAE